MEKLYKNHVHFVFLVGLLLTSSYAGAVQPMVSAALDHTVALKSDCTVVAAGENGSRHVDVDGWSDIVQVSTGSRHTVGLKADGTTVAVGDNSSGRRNFDDWKLKGHGQK